MSINNKITEDNTDKYETLLNSRILGKTLQMKLNQYDALQRQYNTLLSNMNNNGNQERGVWLDLQNENYQTGMVSSPTGSTDSWKFLGKTDTLTNCKLNAIQDKKAVFSSIVYYPSNFGNSWNKSCFGGVKGKGINISYQPKTITSLAPNGTTRLGGEEGEKILKEMKKLQNDMKKLTKEIKASEIGFDKMNTLFTSETVSKNMELSKLLEKLEMDRIEINKTLDEPDQTATEEDSRTRQLQNYTNYGFWMLLVFLSIFVVFYLYVRADSDISIYIYLFITAWILMFIKTYYKTFQWYGSKVGDLISAIPIPMPIPT